MIIVDLMIEPGIQTYETSLRKYRNAIKVRAWDRITATRFDTKNNNRSSAGVNDISKVGSEPTNWRETRHTIKEADGGSHHKNCIL